MNVCLRKSLFCTGTTAAQYSNGPECFSERDAFDTLFDHAPDKLNVVKKVGRFFISEIPKVFLCMLVCVRWCGCGVCGYNVEWHALHTLNTIELYA